MPEPAFPHFSLVALQAGAVFLYGGYYKKKVAMQQFDSHKDKAAVEELSETGVLCRHSRRTLSFLWPDSLFFSRRSSSGESCSRPARVSRGPVEYEQNHLYSELARAGFRVSE